MVTRECEISAPRSCNWHCEHRTKASGNKHCKWVSHVVRTTLLYDLSASRLRLSDLPLPSINLIVWQRARLIKLNYFWAHLRPTVMQHCPSSSGFRTGWASVSGCRTGILFSGFLGFIVAGKNFFLLPKKTNGSCAYRCLKGLFL